MWTKAHRARPEARLKEIVSLHAVGQVARWLERRDPPRRARATPYGAVVRGLAWHLRVGGAWRALPSGLVHWRTAYGWFRRWRVRGLFDVLLRRPAAPSCCAKLRGGGAAPWAASPSRAWRSSIRSPSRASPCAAPAVMRPPQRGSGASAWPWSMQRAFGSPSRWCAVVPANLQDRDCVDALTPGQQAWPSRREAVLDGAFLAERCRQWCNFHGMHGMRHHVVERDPARTGFVVLERRSVVERSFGWLGPWGGLLRDRAGRLTVCAARLALVAVLSDITALLNPRPIHAAIN